MDDLAKQLNILNHEQWYNINSKTLKTHEGARKLLEIYNDSPVKLLSSVYTEYPPLFEK